MGTVRPIGSRPEGESASNPSVQVMSGAMAFTRMPLGASSSAAVFLASKMASYVTGTILPVDGGSWASSGWVRNSQQDWILPPEVTD